MAALEFSRRGLMALGAASLLAGPACSKAQSSIPRVVAALGERSQEIIARSSLGTLPPPNIDEAHGSAWGLDRPHQFLYDDGRLRLLFPTCGFQISMPSMFVFSDTNPAGGRPGQVLTRANVSVFGEYVPIDHALTKAYAIFDEIARQVGAEPVKAYLAQVEGDTVQREPAGVVGPDIFLDQRALVSEVSLQRMVGVNSIDIRIKNMNRAFSDLPHDSLVDSERRRSRKELASEAVYYLDFYIVAPFTL